MKTYGGGGKGRTDVRNSSLLCPTGHRPFGAAAQKGRKEEIRKGKKKKKERKEGRNEERRKEEEYCCGWEGVASNPHLHPNAPHVHKHTQKINEKLVFPLFDLY